MRIFALEGSQKIGAAVAEALGTRPDPHELRAFEDGEHKIRPLVPVRSHNVYVIESLTGGDGHSVNDRLMQLLVFIATCREHGATRVSALVPYLAYSRKDRQTKPFDPVTTRYLAQMFEAVGTDLVATLDVHNLPAFQNAFRCRTMHIETGNFFAADILARTAGESLVVVSPDAGGTKRAMAIKVALHAQGLTSVGLAFVEKHRSEGIVTGDLFAGEVLGKTAVIVDDMISSGGTIVRAARACRERGATRVIAYAAHGVFAPQMDDLLNAVDEVTVSDSVSRSARLLDRSSGKVRVLSCAPLFSRTIEQLETGAA